jgi:carbon monoxide dehydrogenase subunit G
VPPELLLDGLEVELEPDEVLELSDGDLAVDPDDDGDDGLVDGDAEGELLERSPVRELPDSVHAAAIVATSASAQNPLTSFFMVPPPVMVVRPGPLGSNHGATGGADPASPHPEGQQRVCQRPVSRSGRGCTLGHRGRSPHTEDRARMKLEGSYEVPAPRDKVWEAFLDPERVRQAIPGCERLEPIGDDEYRATMKVGVAAVKGTFEGKVRISDKNPPDSYRLSAEGNGAPGFVRANTVITFSDGPAGTRVAYTSDVQVGGLIAGVGQRMLGGVSKMMADQFFNRMTQLVTAA